MDGLRWILVGRFWKRIEHSWCFPESQKFPVHEDRTRTEEFLMKNPAQRNDVLPRCSKQPLEPWSLKTLRN